MDIFLQRLQQFLEIIRPKTYNIMAKSVVYAGLGIVVESQLNILQALLVYLCEIIIGNSEILFDLFQVASTPWLGLSLILIGLVYHAIITVGKDLVELRLHAKKTKPELDIKLLNIDMEEFKTTNVKLRGVITQLPDDNDIPTLKAPAHYETIFNFSGLEDLSHGTRLHPDFFHQRANYLKVWGGAELLKLKLQNCSSALATGVSVEIRLKKQKGLSVDNTDKRVPYPPKRKKPSLVEESMRPNFPPVKFDIVQDHTQNEYMFIWQPNSIQAGAQQLSDTSLFIKSNTPSRIEFTIFCDQFETPQKVIYNIVPSEKTRTIKLSEVQATDEEFDALANDCIMDGYLDREFERLYARLEHQSEELLP